MTFRTSQTAFEDSHFRHWGTAEEVDLYLDRCQVETPTELVTQVWECVMQHRRRIGTVLDFGAGDGRFAAAGRFQRYTGYEVDPARWRGASLPANARLIHRCAFRSRLRAADLCIGNPPYVRNQDLPEGWRQCAARVVRERTGVELSGLANAWQYFFFLALSSTHDRGLVALVIPYEWVSRPSSKALREYIRSRGWNVTVYRLPDMTFGRVLTTASITVVDKRAREGSWAYFTPRGDVFEQTRFAAGSRAKVLEYGRAKTESPARAKRGLSPGSQKVFVLSEMQRAELGLRVGRDVLACVTSLRPLPASCATLSLATFARYYREAGRRCWLLNVSSGPSFELKAYLDSVPPKDRDTATCTSRNRWWQFTMPQAPSIFVATGFRGKGTKAVVNAIGAHAVGSVCGVHGPSLSSAAGIARKMRNAEVASKVVAHSKGLRKLEINQINSLLANLIKR